VKVHFDHTKHGTPKNSRSGTSDGAREREREKKKNSRFGSCIVPVEASNCIQACESTTFWKRDIGDIRQESAGTKAFLVHLSFV